MSQFYFYVGLWAAGGIVGGIAAIVVCLKRRAFTWVTFVGFIVGAKLEYRLELYPVGDALRVSVFELLEPGMRIPLGFFLGGALACLFCLALRGPWCSSFPRRCSR